ncbi:hypothetical protein R6Q59_026982 [Mikania micrantha]
MGKSGTTPCKMGKSGKNFLNPKSLKPPRPQRALFAGSHLFRRYRHTPVIATQVCSEPRCISSFTLMKMVTRFTPPSKEWLLDRQLVPRLRDWAIGRYQLKSTKKERVSQKIRNHHLVWPHNLLILVCCLCNLMYHVYPSYKQNGFRHLIVKSIIIGDLELSLFSIICELKFEIWRSTLTSSTNCKVKPPYLLFVSI